MAEQRGRLSGRMEMPKYLARVGILHQIDDRPLASGGEHGRIIVQPLLDHRSQGAARVRRGIVGEEILATPIRRLIAAEMLDRIGRRVDVWLGA